MKDKILEMLKREHLKNPLKFNDFEKNYFCDDIAELSAYLAKELTDIIQGKRTRTDFAKLVCSECELVKKNQELKADLTLMDGISHAAAELQTENQTLKTELEYTQDFLRQADMEIRNWETENRELQIRLETAIIPRYKVGQVVWWVDLTDDGNYEMFNDRITHIQIMGKELTYHCNYSECGSVGEGLFPTEAAAREALEKMNKGEQE